MNTAAAARANAIQLEAKKHGLRQQQDGCWVLNLKIHQNDMASEIANAAMGTRYVLAIVEVGDDEKPVERRAQAQPRQPQAVPPQSAAGADKPKRAFEDMSPAQQAGMLCNDFSFQRFLQESHSVKWDEAIDDLTTGDENQMLGGREIAAQCIRKLCGVPSRRNLDINNAEWSALVLSYRLWQRHPELSPA